MLDGSFRAASGHSPRVLGLIVNYNGGAWLEAAVGSLIGQTHATTVVVVDNGSTDGSPQAVAATYGGECNVVLSGANLGAAGGYNYALTYEDFDYYFFLNPDAAAPKYAVERLVDIMERHPQLGVLGPAIVDQGREDRVQEFAPRLDFILFTDDAYAGKPTAELPTDEIVPAFYVCAAAMMVRADVFRAVGGCDADFFMFADESDLSWRLRLLGYETAVTPHVRVPHVGGATATVGQEGALYRTSLRRIYLRERNSMWMALKCFATPTLLLYALVNGAHLLAEALVLVLIGKGEIAATYLHALWDVLRSLPRTLAKRRVIQQSRTVPERYIFSFFSRRYGKFAALRERGIPKIIGFTKPT